MRETSTVPSKSLQSLPASSIPLWVTGAVILGALLTAMGAVIALVKPVMLVSPQDQINAAVHIYAGYLAARNAGLALMLVVLLGMRARCALGNLMALVSVIQLLDVCMDCVEGRWALVPGVLIFGVVFLLGSGRLTGSHPWRRAAWVRE